SRQELLGLEDRARGAVERVRVGEVVEIDLGDARPELRGQRAAALVAGAEEGRLQAVHEAQTGLVERRAPLLPQGASRPLGGGGARGGRGGGGGKRRGGHGGKHGPPRSGGGAGGAPASASAGPPAHRRNFSVISGVAAARQRSFEHPCPARSRARAVTASACR